MPAELGCVEEFNHLVIIDNKINIRPYLLVTVTIQKKTSSDIMEKQKNVVNHHSFSIFFQSSILIPSTKPQV